MTKIKDLPVPVDEVIKLLMDERARRAFCQACDIAARLYADKLTIADLPRIDHGLRTAKSLLKMGMSVETAIAGLLNHVTEPQEFAVLSAELQHNPDQIINKLYGLRQLDIYTNKSKGGNERTQEAIRRAALSVIDGDVQVVVIRLVMALHTLVASGKLDAERRIRIATDVLNIYAPLANRLGIWSLKWQLEDLAFRYQQPEKYKEIAKSLDAKRNERDARIAKAKRRLREGLAELGIAAEVTGRPKHIYSIYRKMERKQVSFDEIYDAHALRIILDQDDPEDPSLTPEAAKSATYAQTYRALGLVHSYWTPIPKEYDDYIQYPKPNGYRSLHTAVYNEEGTILEIQIRTRRMHNEAEQGFAAHWAYKEGGRPTTAMLNQIDSLRQVLSQGSDKVKEAFDPANEEPQGKAHKRIYVFTPNEDVIDLPEGATPLDMAYAIHTNVGHRTRGAIVNGKMVSLKTKLRSGDTVRIDTFGKKDNEYAIGRPQREWMNPHSGYAFTTKTRNRVRAWFRKHERNQHIEQGRSFVERELRRLRLKISAEEIAPQFDATDVEDLYAKIGFGDITQKQFDGAVALIMRDRRDELETVVVATPAPLRQTTKQRKGLRVMGETGFETHMAQCCKPVAPEPIIGYVTRGRGVTIHRANCRQIAPKKIEEPERIVSADWGDSDDSFHIPFRINYFNNAHLLEDIANVLRPQNIGIVKTKKEPRKNYHSLYIETEVRNLDQAKWVKKRLEGLKAVFEVQAR